MEIFKYRPLNLNTINSLINDYLYFSEPSAFNDPFDSKLFYKSIDSINDFVDFLNNARINRTIDEVSYNKYTKYLNSLDIDKMNMLLSKDDRFEKTQFAEIIVCSFSECYDNIQMWGHYSGQHTGICLGFKTSEYPKMENVRALTVNNLNDDRLYKQGENQLIPLYKVIYRIDPIEPINRKIRNDTINKYELFLTTKEINWKYEKEWRAIYKTDGNKGLPIKYPLSILSDIYFGVNCRDGDIETVIEIFKGKKRNTKITFWKMIESRQQYKLLSEFINKA